MRTRLHAVAIVASIALIVAACGGGSDSGGDSAPTTAPASGAVDTLTDVRTATIRIEAEGSFAYPEGTAYNEGSVGSGFFISPDGIAVTNNHVVTGAAYLKVYVDGEAEPRNAKILGVSECSDLAVIDVDGDDFEYLTWVEDDITVGLEVYAAGYPLGTDEYTLLDGIVSKEDAEGETSWASVDAVIEHTADILPGNSGGPLVTSDGRLVGINYAGDTEGQAYAIGRSEAQDVVAQLAAGNDVTSIGINGTAMLIEGASGIYVHSVAPGSPADLVGVSAADVVTEIQGIIPADDGTMSDYCDVLRSNDAGAPMQIEVWRDTAGVYLEGTMNTDKAFPMADAAPSPTAGGTSGGDGTNPTGGNDALVVGTCIDDAQLDAFIYGDSFATTECATAHDNEMYAVVVLEDGAYPGDDTMLQIAEEACLTEFVGYVGRDYETSALGLAPLSPSSDTWAAGDRSILCFLYDYEGGVLTGSAYQTGW